MAGSGIHANVKHTFYLKDGSTVAAGSHLMWIADGDYELIDASERHAVAGGAANIQVLKVPSGTAKAAGTNMLSTAGFDATLTANTVRTITRSTTQANYRLARGDAIGVELSAASAALDGVVVTVRLKALSLIGAGNTWPMGPGYSS